MPKKELVISAKFDTSDFDKSVESMQKKLGEMYAPADQLRMQRTSQALVSAGYGPLAGAPGGDPQARMNEHKRNLDKMIRDEKAALEGKVKILKEEEASYKKITEQYQKATQQAKDFLGLEQQVKLAKEATAKAAEEELESETKLNALLKEKQRLSPSIGEAYKQGGISGALGNILGISSGMAKVLMGATGGAAALGGQLLNDWAQRPVGLIAAQGAGMAGTAGRTLGQMQSGEFAYEGMFGEERGRAGEAARKSTDRKSFMDGLIMAGTLGASLLFSERQRAMVFDPQKYSAMQSQQFAEDFGTALGAEKEMSPLKKDAVSRLQKNIYKDIAAQRQMGLGDQEYFGAGGFLEKAISSGFMEDMARESAKGIQAAGGSTAMQRQAVIALQAERGLNLTNATGILGSLSGAAGGAETSKQSLIEIFATAQQIGLDKSKYAEENRRFMQDVAEVVSRGASTSAFTAQQVADQMGGFTAGTTTMRGLENARAAYEAYSQATTATAGYTGAVNTAVMMRQFPDLIKGIGKDPAMMQMMMSMTPEQMDPNSPFFKSMLENYNRENPEQRKTAEQLIQRLQQMHTAQSERYAPGLSEEPKKLARDMIDFMKKGGNLGEYQPTGEAATGFAQYTARLKMIPQYQNLTPQQLERVAMGQAAQEAETMPEGAGYRSDMEKARKKYMDDAQKSLDSKESGKDLDKIIATSAEGAGVSLRTLAKTIDSLADSAARAQAKMTGQEPAMRGAAETYERTSKTGFFEGMLGFDAEAAEGARKVQQNIAAGRDPYDGIPVLERWAYNRAKNQPQASHK